MIGQPPRGGGRGRPWPVGASPVRAVPDAEAPHVLVLNGPNLGRLGRREPTVYGTATYDDLVTACEEQAAELGLRVQVRQSDHEGDLVAWLGEAADEDIAVVLNAGALTHYSYAVRDAAAQVGQGVVEVHLSNTAAREQFRATSVLTPVCAGIIAGFGLDSYRLALRALAARRQPPAAVASVD
ncbi:MAG: 3-dehydroquinate dehydratase [Mycobacterium sp.]|nr:3-dehydroquinate dehydratase [Mycobacterium sp.]MCW2744440.1 3-dehydroquinate dehydratase [Mycobacterium sp.]